MSSIGRADMVVRFFLTMGLYVVTAKWMYAEVTNAIPVAKPILDTVTEAIQIPTHDNWSEEKINAALDYAVPYVEKIKELTDKATLEE